MRLRPSRYGSFWGCTRFPRCKGTHGAHPDGRPLGTPAKKEVREARIKAHAAFDKLWLEADSLPCYSPEDENARARIRFAARGRAYRWLAERMSKTEVHIAEMGLVECLQVQGLCQGVTAAHIRQWWKRVDIPV